MAPASRRHSGKSWTETRCGGTELQLRRSAPGGRPLFTLLRRKGVLRELRLHGVLGSCVSPCNPSHLTTLCNFRGGSPDGAAPSGGLGALGQTQTRESQNPSHLSCDSV